MSEEPPYANHQRPAAPARAGETRKPPVLSLPAKQPYKQPEPSPVPSNSTTPSRSGFNSDFDDIPQQRMVTNQTSPTSDFRQMRSANTQPKDNTFKRMVTGGLSRPPVSNGGADIPPHAGSRPTPAPSQISMQYNAQAPVQQNRPAAYKPEQSSRYQPQQAPVSNQQRPATAQHSYQPPSSQHQSQLSHEPPQKSAAVLPTPQPNKPALYNDRSPNRHISNNHHMNGHSSDNKPDLGITKPSMGGGGNVPPWERKSAMPSKTMTPPSNPQPIQHSSSRSAPISNNNIPGRVPPQSSSSRPPLSEVTSSYGGLYSSKQSPGPTRRRSQYGSSNYSHHPSLTNATDDVKTTTTTPGPFISARPSVI